MTYLLNWPSDETTTHVRELDGELRSEEEVLNSWREYLNNPFDQRLRQERGKRSEKMEVRCRVKRGRLR